MNIIFCPSLQLLAQVRIALKLLYKFQFQIVRTDFQGAFGGMGRFYRESIHRMVRLIRAPDFIRRSIAGIVLALATEVAKWYDCHKDLLPLANIDNWSKICWYSHGTIDFFATAQAFLQDDNLNPRQRFVLSCKYYLEDYVQMLWNDLPEDDLMFIMSNTGLTCDLRFWLDALQSSNTLDWTQITRKVESGNYIYYLTNYIYTLLVSLLEII
ncbi:uncharacterized protein TNCT_211 [Trichonephila clavata]|uniref:Uncharacterized protein n=1 Tax=Trichonephila clavata TaxID=2740835 RepID=A0A8X6L1N7_TRICU|nr:uncharacterized protein TNCT_211 [Trichonephila clavata]